MKKIPKEQKIQGARILYARALRGYSQDQVARCMYYSKDTLCNIEYGRQSAKTVGAKLAKVLGVPEDELLNPRPDQYTDLVFACRGLYSEMRDNASLRAVIGDTLRTHRKEKGISQADLGELCRMSRCRYMELESGKARVRAEYLIRLSTMLGCAEDLKEIYKEEINSKITLK